MTRPHPNYRIVLYDPAWPVTFEAERALLCQLLGIPAERIEHIGSTAIPGLGAKPIVDIMIGVDSEADYLRYVALLSPLGYEHRGDTVPGTLYNRKQGPPRVNAHLTVFGENFWVDKLLFRNYLRANPATASEYEALKRRILVDIGPNPPAYNAAKASFIEDVLVIARLATPPLAPHG